MNEAQMKMVVPPSVGILVAGIASGICFLLIGSFRKGKGAKSVDDSRCACCLKPFLVGRGVECNDCGSRSCRKACCRWDSVDNAWFCLFCYHSRSWSRRKEKWFETFGGLPVEPETSKNFSTAKSRVYDEGAENVAIHSELDLAAGGCKEGDSMETVREFVEKIVSILVGNVDDTSIDRLYDHPAYKPATDTPTMAHTALRDLVERAVDEARKLPGLGATVSTGIQEDSTFPEQNYEELLATAILNKVIEKFQNERVDGNSNVLHGRPRSKHANHENEIGLDEGVEEGSSSLEPLSQDECSSEGSGSRSRSHVRPRQEPMSLTIEEQIEEVTTTYTSDDEIRCSKADALDFRKARRVPFPEFGMDIVDPSQDSSDDSQDEANDSAPVDVITPVESWEENWLFQRRKIQTQSEPVSMLVPNPSADFRALIGDKDAEDTSDLSEFSAQSDSEADSEAEDDLAEAINRVVPKSPRIEKADADFSRYFQNIDKIGESSNRASPEEKQTVDVFTVTVTKIGDRETSSPIKTVGEYRNRQESVEPVPKFINEVSGRSENRFDARNGATEKSEVPKKSASSSTSEPEAPIGCDISRSEEKPVSIDETADEENNRAIFSSRDKIGREDKREGEIFAASSAVNRQRESPTMNGCPKVAARDDEADRAEDESTDRRGGAARAIAANSSREEIESNGNERKIENGSAVEETDRQCQALAQAKADSASEKPSSGSPMTGEDIELAAPPRPGTIAEREHKKWENAAPIENNPYSEENIQKRLLERQYARRSSDVSGSSTKLRSSPSPPLQIVLGAGRPDFKRFGRDYYINEAKFPKGHGAGDNGFYTATSRPNSSLSQHSLSTGSDYEQQVSRGLDRFEEASLWGSLSRRSYRGADASPHFVTNPLVHLVVPDRKTEKSDDSLGCKNFRTGWEIVEEKNRSEWEEALNLSVKPKTGTNGTSSDRRESSPIRDKKNPTDLPIEAKNPFLKGDDSTTNPLMRFPEGLSPVDRDSGMYSIGSVDSENWNLEKSTEQRRKKSAETTTRLSFPRRGDETDDNRGWIGNDRKYWTLESKKFHTFGGIKRRKRYGEVDEDEDFFDAEDVEARKLEAFRSDDETDFFAGLKFQTFGGIKKNERTECERSKSRRRKVRKPMRVLDESEKFENKILSGIFKQRDRSIVPKKSLQAPIGVAKNFKDADAAFDDSQSLKLERPRVPEVVHRSFESLLDLRQGSDSRRKRSARSRGERREGTSMISLRRN